MSDFDKEPWQIQEYVKQLTAAKERIQSLLEYNNEQVEERRKLQRECNRLRLLAGKRLKVQMPAAWLSSKTIDGLFSHTLSFYQLKLDDVPLFEKEPDDAS